MADCYCEKCHKTMNENQFYTYKDGRKTEMCKKCMTMHIDNFNPDTFLWLLEKMDVPYIPEEWNVLRDRAYVKDPTKMNGMSVFGKYISKMKLKQWKNFTYADSEMLQRQEEEKAKLYGTPKEIVESRIENIKEAYARGEISQAQYLTYVETQPDLNVPMGSKNPYPTNSDFEQVQIPDPGAELTEEDKIFLAMKWGRLYKSEDWVALEKVYADYENSFDIHNADLEKGLIQLCKLDLKLNQALDTGDFDSYAKLYRSYDALRKSLKFTEAQNKDGDNSDFDSIGAIVAFCEKEGGFIPRYVTDAPKDVIDIIIQDNKEYLQTLIHNDTNLSQQIEQFLKKKEILLQQKEDRKLAKLKGLDTVEVTDQDYADFYKAMKGGNIIEEEGDEDA